MTEAIHEHYIAKGNILPKLRDKIALKQAADLTGATYKIRYAQPDLATVERTAALVTGSASPSLIAATSFEVEWTPTGADTVLMRLRLETIRRKRRGH